jgi:hypothetical protein
MRAFCSCRRRGRPIVKDVGIGAAFAVALAASAFAGPVEVYREGPQHCPRDRPASAQPLTEAQAIERARGLLPRGFCGPAWYIDGCDADSELVDDTWRVYLHQYRAREGRHDWSGLAHSYVILDRVGNCVANIPGTELYGAK